MALLLCLTSDAQTGLNAQQHAITIQKATEGIKIDGVLNEPTWLAAGYAGKFMQHFPSDTLVARSQTVAKITFDDQNLYVSAVCMQPAKYTVQTLKRDYPLSSSDVFSVMIDPFGDRLNGFLFAVTPYGIQKEGQIFNGNEINADWDNKWTCAAKRYPDRWVVEMAIPFKSLRYKVLEGKNVWNMNFIRRNATEFERSSWVPVGRNFTLEDINFTGQVAWSQPPPKSNSNVILIPYALTAVNRNFLDANQKNPVADYNAGLDAKIAVTPSLNLDLTLNADFAQADVDQQVTDLSRFELFFPERRQFFIENNDLFGGFGAAFNEVRPFFSRRIGLSENEQTFATRKIPIIAGARLSGRINKDWRIGLLNTQMASAKADSLPAANYMVAAIQRGVLKRSNIAALFVNKNNFLNSQSAKGIEQYNRVGGLEFNYSSDSGEWVGKAFVHKSFQPRKLNDQGTAGLEMGYITSKWVVSPALYYIGKNFKAETGYVPRAGILQHPMFTQYYFYPKGRMGKLINNIYIANDYSVTYDLKEKRTTDWYNSLIYNIQFSNTATISGTIIRQDYTWLFSDFDPTNKYEPGKRLLPKGSDYRYISSRIAFKTDNRKLFTLAASFNTGQYFNGKIRRLITSLAYRCQPYGVFSLEADYTRIRLPEGFSQADFLILGSKSEITFSKSIFWTTFLQYNNQSNNININSRLQWRFKPMSDLFLVYTDNYYAENNIGNNQPPVPVAAFGKKNKAFVLKFNYWFNL